jgi:hypothetical protein
MKAMENGQPDDLLRRPLRKRRDQQWFGNLLVNPLMRTTVIEKGDILADHPSGMNSTEDQEMVQAFAPHCTEETLTQRIEAHLRHVLQEYLTYYNGCRPHQGLDQHTPAPPQPMPSTGAVRSRPILSGIIYDHDRVA